MDDEQVNGGQRPQENVSALVHIAQIRMQLRSDDCFWFAHGRCKRCQQQPTKKLDELLGQSQDMEPPRAMRLTKPNWVIILDNYD